MMILSDAPLRAERGTWNGPLAAIAASCSHTIDTTFFGVQTVSKRSISEICMHSEE